MLRFRGTRSKPRKRIFWSRGTYLSVRWFWSQMREACKAGKVVMGKMKVLVE